MLRRIRTWIHRIREYSQFQIWDQDLSTLPRVEAFAIHQVRVVIIVAKGITQGNLALRTSAMTLTSLLSLIPALILGFSILRMFGGFPDLDEQLQMLIHENINPGNQEQFGAWLDRFFESVSGGAFSGFTVVFLAGGVLGLLSSLEGALNDIWGVKRGRSIFQRFATYTTLIVISPLLIVLSISLTASFRSSGILQNWLHWVPASEGLISFGFQLLPVLLTGITFTLLYLIMPNVQVRIRTALPAGLAAAVIWELSKIGYATYLQSATVYASIYGALAAVPLFILWVHLTWGVVLFGAQLTFAQDAVEDIREEELANLVNLRERMKVGIGLALEAARAYRDEKPAPELVALARRMRLPLRLLRTVTDTLTDGGLLHVVETKGEGGIAPARDPDRITIYGIIACIIDYGHVPGRRGAVPDEDSRRIEHILRSIDSGLRERWSSVSISDCLDMDILQEDVVPFPLPPEKESGSKGTV